MERCYVANDELRRLLETVAREAAQLEQRAPQAENLYADLRQAVLDLPAQRRELKAYCGALQAQLARARLEPTVKACGFLSNALANALRTLLASGLLAGIGLAASASGDQQINIINNGFEINQTIQQHCTTISEQIEVTLPPTS